MPPRKKPSVIEFNSESDRTEFDPKEPLFSIDGTLYEARTKFSASEFLKYVRIAQTKGSDAAVDWAMESALGEEGYLAFLDYPYLTADKARQIIDQIIERLVGPYKNGLADPK